MLSKNEFNSMWAELYSVWGPTGSNTFSKTVSDTLAGKVKKYLYPAGKVRINTQNMTVDENSGNVIVSIERYEGSSGAASVKFVTKDGTAKLGVDYVKTSGILNWADGEIGVKTVSISIIDDAVYENGEIKTFSFEINTPTAVTLGVSTLSISIKDNEVLPPTNLPDPNNDPFIVTPHDNIPNFGKNPNIWSIKNGLWSDPSVWNLGRIPAANDIVSITGTTKVTYDVVSDLSLGCISVQADGHLSFAPTLNTRVTTTHFMVLESGMLTLGTDETPIQTGVKCEVVFADKPISANDPAQYGNGLLVFGEWEACGCGTGIPKTFIRLTENPVVGVMSLKLESPALGWNVGDEIFLPDTHQLDWWERTPYWQNYVPKNEVVKIAAISADKKTITIDKALTFDHLGYVEKDNTTSFYPHIGLLSRNLVFRSQNPSGVRGHVLATMAADVNICHAEFRDLGRTTNEELDSTTFNPDGTVSHLGTNQIGRYALHIHHVHGSMSTHHSPLVQHAKSARFTIEGLAVVNSLKWGITIHGSHYGKITNNVVYDAKGSGFAFEDGSESFNVVDGNFVCKVWGTGGRDNTGRDGVGFWFHGPNNYIKNNVAANCYPGSYCYGFSITPKYLGNIDVPISISSMDTISLNSNAITLPQFENNEIYGSCNGLTCWWLGTTENDWIPNAIAGTLKDTKIWNCLGWGYFGYASQNLTIDGLVAKGDIKHIDRDNRADTAIFFSDYGQKGLIIKNCNILGYTIGIGSPSNSESDTLIENCTIESNTDVSIQNFWSVAGGGLAKDKSTTIKDCKLNLGEDNRFGPATLINKAYNVGDNYNGLKKDSCQVINFNQVSGDTFNLYCVEQKSDYIVPENGANRGGSAYPFIGAPVAGLTNTQCLAQYGVCVNGEICPPNFTTRPGIRGLIVA